MKIVRVKHDNDIFYGELIDDKIIRYEGSPFVVWEETEEAYDKNEVQLLAPSFLQRLLQLQKIIRNMHTNWVCLIIMHLKILFFLLSRPLQ